MGNVNQDPGTGKWTIDGVGNFDSQQQAESWQSAKNSEDFGSAFGNMMGELAGNMLFLVFKIIPYIIGFLLGSLLFLILKLRIVGRIISTLLLAFIVLILLPNLQIFDPESATYAAWLNDMMGLVVILPVCAWYWFVHYKALVRLPYGQITFMSSKFLATCFLGPVFIGIFWFGATLFGLIPDMSLTMVFVLICCIPAVIAIIYWIVRAHRYGKKPADKTDK